MPNYHLSIDTSHRNLDGVRMTKKVLTKVKDLAEV